MIARSHRRRVSQARGDRTRPRSSSRSGVTGAVVRTVGGSDAHRLSTAPTVQHRAALDADDHRGAPRRASRRARVSGRLRPERRSEAAAAGVECPRADSGGRRSGAAREPRIVRGPRPIRATSCSGRRRWSCLTTIAADGSSSVVVYDPATTPGRVPDVVQRADRGPERLPVARRRRLRCTRARCSSDPALVQYVTSELPAGGPVPAAPVARSRGSTRTSRRSSTPTARGAWPGSCCRRRAGADDGKLSVLTCRPTAGLTAADCDTIIADFAARRRTSGWR